MKEPEPSLTLLRMMSPNSVLVGAGVSLFKPSDVVVAAEGPRGTVLFLWIPSISTSSFKPGDLLQYSSSMYWIRAIGMLLIISVRRATSIVNIGSTGGGRSAQVDDSTLHLHRDLPACTVDGSLRQVA
jgi:hypothetical protein